MLTSTIRTLVARVLGRHRAVVPCCLPFLRPEVQELIGRIRARRLTYLSDNKLARLARLCDVARAARTEAIFLEAGCALGGSSILLASLKPDASPLNVYDVFGMIPPPSKRDGADVRKRYEIIERGDSKGLGGDEYYGYQENLYDKVSRNFRDFGIDRAAANVALVKGLVQDTLRVSAPVFLAHVDVDWYEPVMTCLERIVPHLHPEGFVVLDDYNDWSGCRRAVRDFFGNRRRDFIFDLEAGNLTITPRSNPWVKSELYALRVPAVSVGVNERYHDRDRDSESAPALAVTESYNPARMPPST